MLILEWGWNWLARSENGGEEEVWRKNGTKEGGTAKRQVKQGCREREEKANLLGMEVGRANQPEVIILGSRSSSILINL